MLNKIFDILQNYFKDMMGMCKGLPLIVTILIVIAIVIIPDPLVILGSIVIKKVKAIVG